MYKCYLGHGKRIVLPNNRYMLISYILKSNIVKFSKCNFSVYNTVVMASDQLISYGYELIKALRGLPGRP